MRKIICIYIFCQNFLYNQWDLLFRTLNHAFLDDIACKFMAAILTYFPSNWLIYLTSWVCIQLLNFPTLMLRLVRVILECPVWCLTFFRHVHDALNQIISKLVNYHVVKLVLMQNIIYNTLLFFVRGNLQYLLNDTAAVSMRAQSIYFLNNTPNDERRLIDA